MGPDGTLVSSTRKEWLVGALAMILPALGCTALGFLTKDPEDLPGDRIAGFEERWLATVLMPNEIPHALAEVHRLFDFAQSTPEEFYRCAGPVMEVDSDPAEAAVNSPDLLAEYLHDENVGHLTYFFAFFKGLRKIMVDAQLDNKAVLHVRQVFLFRRVD